MQEQGVARFKVVNGAEFYRPFGRFLRELPQDYIGTMADVQARYGDLVLWRNFGGMMNFAFISDPALNRELFVRHGEALGKSPSQIQTFLYAAGPSVATAHGEDWRRKRKEANTLFSRKIVEASCAGQVEVVRDFCADLGGRAQDGMTLARRLAALTSSRGILGRRVTMDEADRQIAFSKAAADRFNAESAHLFARPNWMLAPWRRELARRKTEVFPIVQAAIDAQRRSNAANDGLINHYVNGDFVTSNDMEMRSILVGLLMGAQDNIAAATGWILAFMAQYPEVQAQVRAEVSGVGIGAEDLQNCSMLQASLAEVLRLRPPAPANQPRRLIKAVKIADHVLPKGTYVFNSFYNMHHDPRVFERPEAFDPTRFLDKGLMRSPFFAPFGHGPRNCVAQGMAMQQLGATLAGLLCKHRIAPRQETLPEMRQQPFLIPAPFEVALEPI